jgi:hypothetical protein
MSDDEAAREKERQALLKVRGLVDRAQADERSVNKVDSNWMLHGVLAVAGVGVLAAIAVYFVGQHRADQRKAVEAHRAAETAMRGSSPPMPKSFGKRRVQVGDPVEALYRGYVADCFASLEKRANSTHRQAATGVKGRAQVTIDVRSDGILQDVVVSNATGDSAVEPSARRIIRLSEPCGVFPLEVQQVADYLQFKGTVQIDGAAADKVLAFVNDAPR